MGFYDISLRLGPDTARWVNAAPFELLDRRRMQRGDHNNSSSVNMSVHSGTHMDAPFHFVPDGAAIDQLPLDLFIGPALVHEVASGRYITSEHVAEVPRGERILFKTRNSELLRRAEYDPDFTAFSVEAAEGLVAKGYKLVGLDYLSVAHADEQVPVHRAFLDHGLALLEGVDLTGIAPGRYELICFPVRLAGADGAPCRAVLRDLEPRGSGTPRAPNTSRAADARPPVTGSRYERHAMSKVHAAILDDYQHVAEGLLGSRTVPDGLQITVFHDHLTDEDALAGRLREFEAVCVMRERTPFRRGLLERLPNLRLLVTSGMRNASIDMAAAGERGVTVCGTPSVGGPTAELAWGLIIGLLRHIPREDRATRAGAWQETVGGGLLGKTLGVAGLGKLGARVARVGLAFEMDVIAWSRNLTEERCREVGVTRVSQEELLSRSDILTIHLVLSDRTRGLLGAAELATMKPAAVLINTSRGPIVDQDALVDALERGVIAGAGLDVYDTEPLPLDHPLRRCRNTIITPHLGYVEEANYGAYFDGYLAAMRGYLDGAPVNVIKG